MPLRSRLSLAFILVVLVPVMIGAVIVALALPQRLESQVRQSVGSGAGAVTGAMISNCEIAQQAARILGLQTTRSTPVEATASALAQGRVSWAAVTDASGRVVASAGTSPGVRSPVPATIDCRAGGSSTVDALVGTASLIRDGSPSGQAIAAAPMSAIMERLLAASGNNEVTVARGASVISSTLIARADSARLAAEAAESRTDRSASIEIASGGLLARAIQPGPGHPFTIIVSSPEPSVRALESGVLAVLAVTLAIAGILGWQLAKVTTRPLADLAEAASRVAAGDLTVQVPERSRDELGQVARAFNAMTGELRVSVGALRRSNEELRRSLARLSEALSSTHDLERILAVVLDTAMSVARSDMAAVLVAEPNGDLVARVGNGLGGNARLRVPIGEGVAGRAAKDGLPRLWQADAPSDTQPSPFEPTSTSILAVPLTATGLLSVVVLYGRSDGTAFTPDDLNAVRSVAAPASVAIDNALLHEEAQRLATTDALTGLWNFRYFGQTLNREIERAVRFHRPLSVLMLDIDHFKAVNDRHGHHRANRVLQELSGLIRAEIREVDTLARFGGEELVLVLPETGREGAATACARLCESVRAHQFDESGGEPMTVTVSIGAAVYPVDGGTSDELMRAADTALYAAKAAGRDRWALAESAAWAGGEQH